MKNGIFNKIDEMVTKLYLLHASSSLKFYKYNVKPNIAEYIKNVYDIEPSVINSGYNQLYEIENVGNLYIFMPDIDKSEIIVSEFIDFDYTKIMLIIIPSSMVFEPDYLTSVDNLYNIVNTVVNIIKNSLNIYGSYTEIFKTYATPIIVINILKKCSCYSNEAFYNDIIKSKSFKHIRHNRFIKYIVENPFEIYNLLDMGLIIRLEKELQHGESD